MFTGVADRSQQHEMRFTSGWAAQKTEIRKAHVTVWRGPCVTRWGTLPSWPCTTNTRWAWRATSCPWRSAAPPSRPCRHLLRRDARHTGVTGQNLNTGTCERFQGEDTLSIKWKVTQVFGGNEAQVPGRPPLSDRKGRTERGALSLHAQSRSLITAVGSKGFPGNLPDHNRCIWEPLLWDSVRVCVFQLKDVSPNVCFVSASECRSIAGLIFLSLWGHFSLEMWSWDWGRGARGQKTIQNLFWECDKNAEF